MPTFPRDKALDITAALLSEGYAFISNRCEQYESDVFQTRLTLRTAICMRGQGAAELVYDAARFIRKRAPPKPTLWLLLDKGSVSLLDDAAHRHRKAMFMSLMSPQAIEAIAENMAEDWRGRIDRWERAGDVVLFDELREILCGAVCRWAGVPLPGSEVATRTRDFGAMIDGVGAVGPRNWWGMLRRSRAENRIRRVVEQVRSGEREVPEGSAVHVVAFHRGLDGKMLDVATAAVELINVLWPAVHYSVREMSRFRSLQANTLWTCDSG